MTMAKQAMGDVAWHKLVSAAAEASETFGDDELERFAQEHRSSRVYFGDGPGEYVDLEYTGPPPHDCLLCSGSGTASKGTRFECRCPDCGGSGMVSAQMYSDQCGRGNELDGDVRL